MKVLLVNGSPNEAGCTYVALKEIAGALEADGIESEIFWIGKEPVGGCKHCGKCRELKECVIDDGVNVFLKKAREADGFVFGTPVHFAGAGGNITGFMDRAFFAEMFSGANAFRLKPAAVVVAARRAGTTAAFDQMIKYPAYAEMFIVSSSYWNMVFGAKAEDVAQDAEGLFTMRTLGRNMAYLLKSLNTSEVEPPLKEKKPFTNFIR
ncbi:MAG: flavodoxin family protein [Clostridiales bacterium]|jgi:multimeric flavodoxin WrbA|nr:flavodoxin family protein [Clostridiales bacterium]